MTVFLSKPELEGDDSHSHYQENEEQLQQRLVQLLNLPVHHVAPPMTTPRGAIDDASSTHVADSDSFLRLDCAALAESLSSIPLHQMLGISPDLVQLCEMEAVQPRTTADSAQAVTTPPPPLIDLTACTRKRKKEYAFEFKAPPGIAGSLAGDTGLGGSLWGGGNGPLVAGSTEIDSPLEGKTSAVMINESAQADHKRHAASNSVQKEKGGIQEDAVLRSLLPEGNVTLEGSGGFDEKDRTCVHSEPEQSHSPEDKMLDRLLAGTSGGLSEGGAPGRPAHGKDGGSVQSEGSSSESVQDKAQTSRGLSPIPPLVRGKGVSHVQEGVGSALSEEPAQGTLNTAELDDMLDDLLS